MAYNKLNTTKEATRGYICYHCLLQASIQYAIEFCSSNKQIYPFTTSSKHLPCQILSMHCNLQKEFGGKSFRIFQMYRKFNISIQYACLHNLKDNSVKSTWERLAASFPPLLLFSFFQNFLSHVKLT